MNTLIIACQMISDELNLAISRAGVDYPVIWIESRFHEQPDQLRERLQDVINHVSNVQYIILAFGYCGNALLGLEARKASLVIPRVDDCISLLLGSQALYHKLSNEVGTYFLTGGWLKYENGILNEFSRNIKRYGQARAYEISKVMLAHYSRLVLIDTGAYDIDVCLEKVQRSAKILGIAYEVIPGSGELLTKLLEGPWHDFSIIPPGSAVTEEHLWAQIACSIKCVGQS